MAATRLVSPDSPGFGMVFVKEHICFKLQGRNSILVDF